MCDVEIGAGWGLRLAMMEGHSAVFWLIHLCHLKKRRGKRRKINCWGGGALIGIAGAENKKAQTRFRELSIKNANYL